MKTVVITGSTRGIGRGLAEQFLARGCNVVVSGRSEAASMAAAAELSAPYGEGRAIGVGCEITDSSQLQVLWDKAAEAFGRVDIWINNAGISLPRLGLAETEPADIERIVAVNLTGMVLANRVAVRGMLAQGSGQIWNMEGFGSGDQMQPGMAPYGSTKRAVTYLTKSLHKELKGTDLQICALSPGIVITELLIGDYDTSSPDWQKSKKIFNILGDKVETVTPFLVDGMLKTNKSGARVAWLTGGKAFGRFMTAAFKKRDLFADIEGA